MQIMGYLSAACIAASIVVFFLPMHRLSFFTGFVIRAVRMDTHLLTLEINEKDSGFCSWINVLRPGTCSGGSHTLQDVAQRFCAPQVKFAYPQGCDGFQAAFYLGIMLALSLLFNAIGLCTMYCALRSYILGDNHKRSYRKMGLIALVISTVQLGMAVCLYAQLVYRQPAKFRGNPVLSVAIQKSGGIGASYGIVLCFVIVGVQMFMIGIWKYTKTSEEQADEEIKERKLFAAEAQAYEGYGADGAPAPPLAVPGQSWGPQGEQVLFAAGGVAAPQMQWATSGDPGGMMQPQPLPRDFGVAQQQPVGAYHAAPYAAGEEVQPAPMRRGETYLPEAPPGSAV